MARLPSFLRQLAETRIRITPDEIGINNTVRDADAALRGILTTVYFWAGILSVMVIIVAGYIFATANGDASKVQRAKYAIVAAASGLAIVVSAFVLTQFILGRF